MKIGIFLDGRMSWIAGHTYLINLLRAVRLVASDVHIDLLQIEEAADSSWVTRLESLADRRLVYKAQIDRHRWRARLQSHWYSRVLQQPLPDQRLADFIERSGVDAVFGSWGHFQSLPRIRNIALCPWIHDFQHIRLPEMFSESAILERNTSMRKAIAVADRIVVSSEDARNDLVAFSPSSAIQARILPFVAHIPETVYSYDLSGVLRAYSLPPKFVYAPNQFWKHKNHRLALEALRILASQGVHPCIVFTGFPYDYRHENHFAELLQLVSQWDLRAQAIFLGLVPLEHVHALMRQSVCVLNPSLFEGWSSTVEEAKSLGKGMLLSDLPVHREQDPPASYYFAPQEPDDLAAKLGTLWSQLQPGPDLLLEQSAREALPDRMREFGRSLLSIMHEAPTQ